MRYDGCDVPICSHASLCGSRTPAGRAKAGRGRPAQLDQLQQRAATAATFPHNDTCLRTWPEPGRAPRGYPRLPPGQRRRRAMREPAACPPVWLSLRSAPTPCVSCSLTERGQGMPTPCFACSAWLELERLAPGGEMSSWTEAAARGNWAANCWTSGTLTLLPEHTRHTHLLTSHSAPHCGTLARRGADGQLRNASARDGWSIHGHRPGPWTDDANATLLLWSVTKQQRSATTASVTSSAHRVSLRNEVRRVAPASAAPASRGELWAESPPTDPTAPRPPHRQSTGTAPKAPSATADAAPAAATARRRCCSWRAGEKPDVAVLAAQGAPGRKYSNPSSSSSFNFGPGVQIEVKVPTPPRAR